MEQASKEYRFTTPLSEDDVRKLNAGDIVYLTGYVFGIRDATLRRIFDENVVPPINLSGSACLHTAPNVKKIGGKFIKLCIGTTTSTRMEKYSPRLISRYGVRAIIGKAGLLKDSLKAMQTYGAVYLAIGGGCAALETTQIEEIETVYWEDLFPECLWHFRVQKLGPLLVAMDTHGTNLYSKIKERARSRLPEILRTIGA